MKGNTEFLGFTCDGTNPHTCHIWKFNYTQWYKRSHYEPL